MSVEYLRNTNHDRARGNIYALEGLDGVGKTSVGKQLAKETGGTYLYCTDGSRLKCFRKHFDGQAIPIRFIYYYMLSLETRSKALMLAKNTDVFIDRYLPSTVTYHRALGLNAKWFSLVPNCLWDEISAMIYIQIYEEERIRRLGSRNSQSKSDKISIDLANKLETEYMRILPKRTLIIQNDGRTIDATVQELKARIYE